MTNPVLMLHYNSAELTMRAINSLLMQDIPVRIVLIDNGSVDGSGDQIRKQYADNHILYIRNPANIGVTKPWNDGLDMLFQHDEHVLVVGNDMIFPPFYYRLLLEADEPFVTGVSIEEEETLYWSCGQQLPPALDKSPHPDFSSFLIRKSTWEKVGPFDERFVMYAQDADYHVRMFRAGIWAGCVPIRVYHRRSSTLRNATPEVNRAISLRADQDREEFRMLYGCMPGDEKYQAIFRSQE